MNCIIFRLSRSFLPILHKLAIFYFQVSIETKETKQTCTLNNFLVEVCKINLCKSLSRKKVTYIFPPEVILPLKPLGRLRVNVPVLSRKAFKHHLYMRNMVIHCFRINQYIVHINQHTLVQQVSKQQVHRPLELRRHVFQTIWHHDTLKRPIPASERSLKTVLLSNWDLMITLSQVKLTKIFCAFQPCQHLINPQKRPRV